MAEIVIPEELREESRLALVRESALRDARDKARREYYMALYQLGAIGCMTMRRIEGLPPIPREIDG